MIHFSLNRSTDIEYPPFIYGEAEISAVEQTYTIDVSEDCPLGVEGAFFCDVGETPLAYSYTECDGKVTVYAPSFVIDQAGEVVLRTTKATFKYLIVGKR